MQKGSLGLLITNLTWIYGTLLGSPNTRNLRNSIEGSLLVSDYLLKIRDIYIDHQWDFTKLSIDIPSEIKENILKARVRSNGPTKDVPIWFLSNKWFFTTKSCYNLIEPSLNNQIEYSWVWTLPCPNKIKYFLWQCLHNKLPCRKYLPRIGINIDPICHICDSREEEIVTHIFFDYKTTKPF